MKNFIKSQENIIKEICNEDSNYIETSLSFIEKTLKVATNETDKTAYDLIEEYITNDELLDKIHNLRMDANQIKHHKDEEFEYYTAMNYLKTLNQYLDFIQDKFKGVIETTDFIKLYDKIKKELEKKKIVEKKVNVVKKEIITIEKPVYKEIVKEGYDIDNNLNYTEVQLLNESNNKGLLYNAIYLKKINYAIDILNKKIEHNIKISSNEEEIINNNIKDVYQEIKYQLTLENTFLYFNDELIINMIMIEKDINLIYQYILLKSNYNLLNDKLYELLGYYIDNNDDAIKIIVSFKDKIKPIDKLRDCVSKHLDVSKVINFFNLFENDDIKKNITFNKLSKNYNLDYNEKLVKCVEKYRWGKFLIVDDYITNKDTIVTYEVFERNYLKIGDNKKINESIIVSNNENTLGIIKNFDKNNIPIFNDISEYISSSNGDLSEYYLSKVNRKIIYYCINKKYFKSDKLINGLFLYYLNKLDYEIVDKLIDMKLFNEKDFYQYNFDSKISNDKEYQLMLKFYNKNKFIPVYLIANMYEYNYELSCQKLNDYLKNNISITTRYYIKYDYREREQKIYYFNSDLRYKIYKMIVTEENDRDNLIRIFKTIIKISTYNNDEFINILTILNKKDIYLKDVLNHKLIDDRGYLFEYLFENNLELINNLDDQVKLPIFSNRFIIEHYDNKYIKTILNNKEKSDGCLIRDIIEEEKYDVIKKLVDIGLDFTKINEGVIENKRSTVYQYHKTMGYASAFDYYRVIHYSYNDKVYAFLAYIKAKQFIKKQDFILECNIDGHDFLDDLLIKPDINEQALKFIQDEYVLKDLYGDFLKTPSKSFSDFKKKLFIDCNYLNNSFNYDELLSFNITEINKLHIEFDKLKNIFNYYCKLNDDKKINKIKRLKNKKLIEYVKTKSYLFDKIDDEIKKSKLKSTDINSDSLININKLEEKSKSSSPKESNFGEKCGEVFSMIFIWCIMHFSIYLILYLLIVGMMLVFKIDYFDLTLKDFGFIFLIHLLIESVVFIICCKKHMDFEDVVLPVIVIISLFTIVTVFTLNFIHENSFYKNVKILNMDITDKCTVITLKNNNKRNHAFDFDDVSFGYHSLYTGSHNKIYYGNKSKYNKEIESLNIKEIQDYCNIDYELKNPVVYSIEYVSGACGQGYQNTCTYKRISNRFELASNKEVTLVFDAINENANLTINGIIIER